MAEPRDNNDALARAAIDLAGARTEIKRLEDEVAKQLTVLRQIADPSYVGSYSAEEVVVIYRKWAARALSGD